jgi:glycosyltransferase involved in cell wall biosynthesis
MPLALGFTSFLKFKNYNVISTFLHYDPQYNLVEHLTLPFYHYLEKRQFKKHKNIITISNASKKDITKHYGIENKNIKVLPIGVDTSLFNPNNESNKIRARYGNNTLLYVGPFVKRKRIPVLLKAMTYVLKEIPDAHLILIGNGLLLDHCKDLARNLNLNENTSFLGFIGEEKLTKYYASSDLFVFASELEGFGQVLLEAMASGTPVICANKDPMREIVGDGGWTFKLNDPIDLSKKIIHLLKYDDILKELSDKAIKRAKKYNLEEIAKKWVEIIWEISNHRVIYPPP